MSAQTGRPRIPAPSGSFGERLYLLRNRAGLSCLELANRGVSLSAIHLLESGRRQPSYAMACRLAVALGCRLTDLQVVDPARK